MHDQVVDVVRMETKHILERLERIALKKTTKIEEINYD